MKWQADALYGFDGGKAVIDDVVLTTDKDGEVCVELWTKLNCVFHDEGGNLNAGHEMINETDAGVRLWLGGQGSPDNADLEKRRKIALDQLGKLAGVEGKLPDNDTTILRLSSDYKGKDSLFKALKGKLFLLRGNAARDGKVYLNVYLPYTKPKSNSLDEVKKRLAANRAKMNPAHFEEELADAL